MAFNGSGTFLINTAGQPVVSGTVISSTAFNALTADLATGLSTAITKDGQTTVTANIPMSTYKFTGLGVGSAAGDSANLSQVQSTVTKLLTSVSGADTVTATASPTLAAYAAGQMFYFVTAGDNTTSVTLNIDALGAKAVTRDGSVALAAGDIKSGEVVVVVYDGTRFQVVSQLNSAGDARFANVSIASSLYVGGVSTFVGNAGFSANVSIASALSVGGVAAITGATTIGGNLTLNGGTANGVLYLNGSKVATSGSALVFDGTNLGIGTASPGSKLDVSGEIRIYPSSSPAILRFGVSATEKGKLSVDTSSNMAFETAGTERLRLDSSGNLGIGTTSPAYKLDVTGTSTTALSAAGFTNNSSANNTTKTVGITFRLADTVGVIKDSAYITAFPDGANVLSAGVAFSTRTGDANPTEKMRLDSSGNLFVGGTNGNARLTVRGSGTTSATASLEGATSGGASRFLVSDDGLCRWYGTSNAETMRLDNAGNLGIGTSSPDVKLRVDVASPTRGIIETVRGTGSTGSQIAFSQDGVADWAIGQPAGANAFAFFSGRSPGADGTERARITSDGDLLVGTTANSPGAKFGVLSANSGNGIFVTNTSGTSSYNAMAFYNNGTSFSNTGAIVVSGSTTAYNTSSDRRLKDNISPADNAGAVIDAIEVVKHDWKVGGHTRYGMIAQDLHMVAPEAVSVGDDGEELKTPWGVDYSKLVPMLVKEIQSLRARVAQLETK
jgi:hypothetical protein